MQFLSPPPAGQLVGFHRGCLLVAKEEMLYPSEPYAYELFDHRRAIALDDRITLIASMEDKERPGEGEGQNSGLFIGTERSCGVLIGKDPNGFQYIPKMDYGAIQGTLAYIDGSVFGDNKAGARPLPVWITTKGLCAGMPQMEIINLTRTKFTFPVGNYGASVFLPEGNRLIMTTSF